MDFEDWLVSEGLSASTVKKYVGAITGPLSQWSIEHNITSKPLSEVTDAGEFGALCELIESTDVFAARNTRGNHMYSAALNNYSRYLALHETFISTTGPAASLFSAKVSQIEKAEAEAEGFDPRDIDDARERILRAVVTRRGRSKFRSTLISAYEGRCAITHCSVLEILDAAHVTPYLGSRTNAISNGMLLRTDVHTLWDLGLIAINPDKMTVSVSPYLHDESYQDLGGKPVFQPAPPYSRVSTSALTQQWNVFLAHLAQAL